MKVIGYIDRNTDCANDYDSVLGLLEDQRVFSIHKTESGSFLLEEKCDQAFDADLTKAQLLGLAQELIELVK